MRTRRADDDAPLCELDQVEREVIVLEAGLAPTDESAQRVEHVEREERTQLLSSLSNEQRHEASATKLSTVQLARSRQTHKARIAQR